MKLQQSMIKPVIGPIEGENVCLRMLTEADLPMTLRWRNQDQIRRWFKSSGLIKLESHRNWFKHYKRRNNDFVFIIEELKTFLRPVGQVALYHIDFKRKRSELGRLLIGEDEARGMGIAREATQLLLNIAFNRLKMDEVYLEVFKNNAPAITIYRQCGFQICGVNENLLMMHLYRTAANR